MPPAKALIDRETARIQTLQSALIAALVGKANADEERTVAAVWDRIYAVTAFYAGLADDLTIYDYRQALRDTFGNEPAPAELVREDQLAKFIQALSDKRKPAIFGGTGGAGIEAGPADVLTIAQLDGILDATQGFRFMGQRYIPDSYMLGQVVTPAAGMVQRKLPERFTVHHIEDARSPDGISSIRAFPRGLDVFNVLGSDRAAANIQAETDHEYRHYQDQIVKLRQEFRELGPGDWNRNLYWSWLYCLKALVEPRGDGYQTFQQGDAWTDRQLNSALASWASLRHDTILYAKQSYTPEISITSVPARPAPPPPPKGLVEPAPEFFARILAMTRMTTSGLEELKVLSGPARTRLENLEKLVERLYEISKRQVQNQPLEVADSDFLARFPQELKGTIGEVDDEGLKTTLVADVHTDLNTKQCLEEGSGNVDYLIVAYRRPAGDVVLAVGPVLSYYEFKQPMADRLTDEQWRKMLAGASGPDRPRWNASFTALTK